MCLTLLICILRVESNNNTRFNIIFPQVNESGVTKRLRIEIHIYAALCLAFIFPSYKHVLSVAFVNK